MRNILKVVTEEKDRGKYLKDYLKGDLKLSSRIVKRLSYEKQIFVDKKPMGLHKKLKGNEEILIVLDKKEEQFIEPVYMPLDIVYEDSSLIVINKPPYTVVHPTKSHQEDTLANGVAYYFKEKKENTIVRFVSRLDMNTSGLVLLAKNQFTHSYFAREMARNNVLKQYQGIVCGIPEKQSGTIEGPILKENEESFRRIIHDDGKYAKTDYKVLEEFKDYSLLEFTLHTGRTHQIRVHISSLNHPIVNDELYGGELFGDNPRQFLHAYRLKFRHPIENRVLDLEVPLPTDMVVFIDKIKDDK